MWCCISIDTRSTSYLLCLASLRHMCIIASRQEVHKSWVLPRSNKISMMKPARNAEGLQFFIMFLPLGCARGKSIPITNTVVVFAIVTVWLRRWRKKQHDKNDKKNSENKEQLKTAENWSNRNIDIPTTKEEGQLTINWSSNQYTSTRSLARFRTRSYIQYEQQSLSLQIGPPWRCSRW